MSRLLLLGLEVSFCVAFVGRGQDLDLFAACTGIRARVWGQGLGRGLLNSGRQGASSLVS